MKIEIKSRWSGLVLFSFETDSVKVSLEAAVKQGADLEGANLKGADLTGADLKGADLKWADLTPIRDDLWAVLSSAPAEVEGLRKALVDGKVDGSAYSGDCACLVGTLAKIRGCAYTAIPGLTPDGDRPAERFFIAIKPGDTPENSPPAKLAVEWIDAWLGNVKAAFAAK